MEVPLTPDAQEALQRLSTKVHRTPAELIQAAVSQFLADEAQSEALEIWKESDWLAAMPHVAVGFLAFEPGQPIDTVQARRDIQEFKDYWRKQRRHSAEVTLPSASAPAMGPRHSD